MFRRPEGTVTALLTRSSCISSPTVESGLADWSPLCHHRPFCCIPYMPMNARPISNGRLKGLLLETIVDILPYQGPLVMSYLQVLGRRASASLVLLRLHRRAQRQSAEVYDHYGYRVCDQKTSCANFQFEAVGRA